MSKISAFKCQKVCRTCLTDTNLQSLYNKNSSKTCLNEMLMICTSLNCYENDGLPIEICTDCISELNRSYQFALKCRGSDTQLRNYIKIEKCLKDPLDIIKHEIDMNIIKSEPDDSTNELFEIVEDVVPIQKLHLEAKNGPNHSKTEIFVTVKVETQFGDDMELENTNQIEYQSDSCKTAGEEEKEEEQNQQIHVEQPESDDSKVIQIQTGEKSYSCSICDRSFARKTYLTKHILTHNRVRPYSCTFCDKSFTLNEKLVSHMQTHTGEKPFSCTECNCSFSKTRELMQHQRTHAGDSRKPYSCTVCLRSFVRKYYLAKHMTMHNKEKPNVCTVCGRAFILKYDLSRHMVLHAGEKPYSCKMCGKAFNQSRYLTSHMQIHTREKPCLSCSVCGKTFRKPYLKIHMRTHTGERPYACSICGISYRYLIDLTNHKQKHIADKLTF